MKSGNQDRVEGAMDTAKGRTEEALGALTGNKKLKAKGRLDQMKGTAREKKGKLKKAL
jgi:uncharacterized protein YjbJ (UPF0337 family)